MEKFWPDPGRRETRRNDRLFLHQRIDAVRAGNSALLRALTPRREISRALGLSAGSLVAISIMLLWCVITYGGLVDTTFCPPPHQVLLALWKVIADGSLFKHAWSSLVVINLGFLLSSV